MTVISATEFTFSRETFVITHRDTFLYWMDNGRGGSHYLLLRVAPGDDLQVWEDRVHCRKSDNREQPSEAASWPVTIVRSLEDSSRIHSDLLACFIRRWWCSAALAHFTAARVA